MPVKILQTLQKQTCEVLTYHSIKVFILLLAFTLNVNGNLMRQQDGLLIK